MRIKFWGVRGSIPTPLTTEQLQDKLFRALSGAQHVDLGDPAAIRAYIAGLPSSVNSVVGGNTTCVQVTWDDEMLIIDAGSGMRALGHSLMASPFGKGQGVGHIFLTHAHWDHLQGYPFFLPAYIPGNHFTIYAVNYDPQLYLEHQQQAPVYFPVPTSIMGAQKKFVQLREGETVQIGRMKITSLALYHPGTAYAYRFDDGEGVFVFASDGEYKSLAEPSLRRYVDFFRDADALVFDSQYSLRDVFFSRADWGHSSAIIGVDIAERAHVKRLITFHHEPTHTDEQIYQIAETARQYAAVNKLSFQTEIIVGTENLELTLGRSEQLRLMEERTATLCRLELAGALTHGSARDAQRHIRLALASAPEQRLLLDLTYLETVENGAMKEIVQAMQANPQARLAIVAPMAAVQHALAEFNAQARLPIFPARSQALRALS
ncbi:MAG: MBL fold metallo-hydrolase [Anaerolineales bacterium]|nr:MBL fold metallo-hydrolase [Anaerolineales bacterium]